MNCAPHEQRPVQDPQKSEDERSLLAHPLDERVLVPRICYARGIRAEQGQEAKAKQRTSESEVSKKVLETRKLGGPLLVVICANGRPDSWPGVLVPPEFAGERKSNLRIRVGVESRKGADLTGTLSRPRTADLGVDVEGLVTGRTRRIDETTEIRLGSEMVVSQSQGTDEPRPER